MDIKGIDFQSLFEASPSCLLTVLPDAPKFTIVAVNDAYLKATMTKKEEILGKGIFEAFPDNPNDAAATGVANLRASLNRVLQNKAQDTMPIQKYDVQLPAERGGGFEEKFWSPINTPVLDANGAITYIIHRVEDITEFVKLNQQKGELQTRSDEMQIEIFNSAQKLKTINENLRSTNTQLVKKEKEISELYEKLSELDVLKTQFFANVSHELRTPLTLILAPIERLIESPNLTKQEVTNFKIIERNSKTLLKHVNDLLDVAKLDAGKLKASYSDVDIAKLVRFVCSHFEGIAEEKKIKFQVDTPKELRAEIDLNMIQKVFTNLLSNAFKFTPETGTIKVSLTKENGDVCLKVQDTGPGVPKEYQDAIFERFRQVEGGSNRRFGGTGLGLAIAKEFVAIHNGTIKVANAKRSGAVFTITLPRKAPLGIKVSKPTTLDSKLILTDIHSNPQASSQDIVKFSNIKNKNKDLILIVEDNADMNHFLSEILSESYRVVSAYNGIDGLSNALSYKPDLIITDLMMPLMSGDALVNEIRKNPELWATPVIMLTAKNEEHLKVDLLKNGVEDYILKPFHPDELMARVRNLLSTKRTREILQRGLRSKQLDIKILSKDLVESRDEIRKKNAELMETNSLLRKALKARDEFLSIASHELKTPLTSLQLQLQLLDRNIKPESGKIPSPEYIKDASLLSLRQIKSLTHLVETLLDISRFRLGKTDFILETANLSELIQNAVNDMTIQLQDVGCIPHLHLDSSIEANVDKVRFQQVITNLISNIIKYAPGKPFEIFLGQEKGDTATIRVKDNGSGIEKDKQQIIFNQFERAGISKNISGLGLGLFIAREIVKSHKGEISVNSDIGMGAEFIIELPLHLRSTDLKREAWTAKKSVY